MADLKDLHVALSNEEKIVLTSIEDLSILATRTFKGEQSDKQISFFGRLPPNADPLQHIHVLNKVLEQADEFIIPKAWIAFIKEKFGSMDTLREKVTKMIQKELESEREPK